MAWRVFEVSAEKKEALEEILKDDTLWRQTRLFREAQLLGGKSGNYYLYMNGSEEAMSKADAMTTSVATKVTGKRSEEIYAQIKDEEDRAASGMGLIFAE